MLYVHHCLLEGSLETTFMCRTHSTANEKAGASNSLNWLQFAFCSQPLVCMWNLFLKQGINKEGEEENEHSFFKYCCLYTACRDSQEVQLRFRICTAIECNGITSHPYEVKPSCTAKRCGMESALCKHHHHNLYQGKTLEEKEPEADVRNQRNTVRKAPAFERWQMQWLFWK